MLPEYVGEESESSVGEVDMNRLDPMFEDAARLVVIHQQGSTSLIQRKSLLAITVRDVSWTNWKKLELLAPLKEARRVTYSAWMKQTWK